MRRGRCGARGQHTHDGDFYGYRARKVDQRHPVLDRSYALFRLEDQYVVARAEHHVFGGSKRRMKHGISVGIFHCDPVVGSGDRPATR